MADLPDCYRCGCQPCTCRDGITLYHGDALDVLPLLEPGSVRLLWTDPPYGHGNHNGDLNAQLNKHRHITSQPIANDGADAMRQVVDAMFTEAVRVLSPDCCCCCCCCGGGPRPTFAWVANRMDTSGLTFFHSVIWDKRNPGLGWRFRRQHEMVMVAHRDGGRLAWSVDKRAIPNILSYYPPRKRLHPNEKPIELASGFIEWTTQPGELVLDPFAGSGTTGRACKDLGRKCIMVEIEERYCDIIVERLRQEVLFT